MSHHFDSEQVRQDGRVDLCDVYLFAGLDPDTTVMIMTVNPMAGEASPTTFRPDAAYEFKLDCDGDAVEDVSFRLSFSDCSDTSQSFVLDRIDKGGIRHTRLASGRSGELVRTPGGLQVWAGLAAEPFHFTGGYFSFSESLLGKGEFDLEPLSAPGSFFDGKNISGIALQVPTESLAPGRFSLWCTTAVHHDGCLEQLNRHAIPALQLILQRHPDLGDAYNTTDPVDDRGNYLEYVASTVARACDIAGSCEDPEAYGRELAGRFLPNVLTYDPTQRAVFSAEVMNGRPLVDDAMGAFWSAMTHTRVEDTLERSGYRKEFPYLAEPHPQELLPDE